MDRRRKWRIAAVIVVSALVLQVVTYLLFAEGGMIRTVERYLPQYTHYSTDPHFRWVCVGDRTAMSFSHRQRATMDRALKRHFEAVYWGRDAILPVYMNWHTDHDGKKYLIHVQDGCIIEWSVVARGPLWFTGSYGDWEGSEAAMGRGVTFIWVLGRWWKVWTHGAVIS
jgi:hypothetical protein